MKNVSETFNIKQASEFSGLSEATIRYYEKIGLIPYADRKANGHRIYSEDQIKGMMFLTRLKTTGMKLEDIKRYLQLSTEGPASIQERISILEEQKKRIKNDISQLLKTQRIIDYKIDHYNETLLNPDLNDSNCDPTE
ncbi:MerR family transcriptional regulator [Gracilibacillus thailandensis]|uniref:MerR family DNA-binding transcriptional regulator n=1 Tax=Gracilibacillus thailandensis TaxID=563735 RepID=A0A6N7R4Z1_9BACI|nr:MerR family transcriptional regulator [Gracilibacillus thailandensis]MRI68264.1 MerR family DNA-binding transcriptional regulator [Gracilibacillus thailandensis]